MLLLSKTYITVTEISFVGQLGQHFKSDSVGPRVEETLKNALKM
jgi:hypothetical protein